ncbi:MFS transporter [Trichophyton equinum CBS 127.97]|uniref:MFS transporter n=1 Tax=Trichophyton equinum (strain ATCC MYA-4606 / CBS 127.97) TaxID=559882 RepID=F2PV24_TRIEC|nr:MFS transporter [Trichophyton equinum CBS 127.97]
MTKSTRPLAIPSHIEGTRTDDIISESMLTPASSSTGWANEDVTSTSLSGRGVGLKRLETEIPNEDDRPGISPSREDEADDEQDGEDNELDRSGNERYRDNPGREVEDDLEIASYSLNSYTPEEERQVIRKFDRRLTMFLAFLYLLSFLDRSNIGNARIAGLMDDLNLSSGQYEWALTAFYITYICFEWMTLMYKILPAHIYIPICVFSWGVLASMQCLVTSFWQLVFLRALIGVSEAAFSPGVPFFLSFFYKREELAFRTGMILCAAPLATSFAGSLAWFIVWVSENGPIAPWRALFLYEGFPSIIVAFIAWSYIPDGPGKAKYLTPRERKVAKLRLKAGKPKHEIKKTRFDWGEVGRTLCDPKSYLTAFMFLSCNVAFSSLPVFLPTILHDMGYSKLTSQALSAPPYLFAFVVVLLYPAAPPSFFSITLIIAWTMDNKLPRRVKVRHAISYVGQETALDREEDAMLRTEERDGATERLMGPGVSKSPAAMEKTSQPRFVYII